MDRRRVTVRIACLSTALAVVAGCSFDSGGSDSAGSSEGGGSLVIADLWAPDSGYALETDDAFTLTRAGCLETLVAVDDKDQPQPALATKWSQTTPTTWQFTLRETKFQNGTPLTAAIVTADLTRLLKATAPPRSFSPKVISAVTTLDAHTVQITTPSTDLFLPQRLSVPNTGILAPQAFTGGKTNPVGTCTGPFEITSTGTGQSLSLTANTDYWGGKVALDKAEIRYVEAGETRATQLRTGEVDVAANLPVASLTTLDGDSAVRKQQTDLPRTTGLYLNLRRAPFTNLQARRAVQAALGLKAIVAGVYEGQATAAAGPFSPDEPWAPHDAKPVEGDAAAARTILSAAHINPATLSFQLIAYTDRPEFADLAQVIQAQLAKAGITITIRTGEYASVEDDLMAGKFDATLLSRNHLIDLPEPIGLLGSDEACKGSFNLAGFCSTAIDALIDKAGTTTNQDARYALYGQIAAMLQAQVAFVPLVHERLTIGIRSRVKNLPTDPLERTLLTREVSIS